MARGLHCASGSGGGPGGSGSRRWHSSSSSGRRRHSRCRRSDRRRRLGASGGSWSGLGHGRGLLGPAAAGPRLRSGLVAEQWWSGRAAGSRVGRGGRRGCRRRGRRWQASGLPCRSWRLGRWLPSLTEMMSESERAWHVGVCASVRARGW
eukprot:372501-Rhodomonas_salina.1